jgi:hypothetical protein
MLVYHVFFWIPSVLLPDISPLLSCSSVHLVSELVIYEMYLFGIGAGMEHHIPPQRNAVRSICGNVKGKKLKIGRGLRQE